MRPPELTGVARDPRAQFAELRKAYDYEKARADGLQTSYDNIVNRALHHQTLHQAEKDSHRATKEYWGQFQHWANQKLWEFQRLQIQANKNQAAQLHEAQRKSKSLELQVSWQA